MEKSTPQQKDLSPKRKLTKKERGFVKDYVETENGSLSAKKNYDVTTDGAARSVAYENLTKPHIIDAIEETRKTLRDALEERGVTPQKVADGVKTLLEAVDDEGNPDYHAIDKGVTQAAKIGVGGGYVSGEEAPPQTTGNIYNIFFKPSVQLEVKAMEDKIKSLLTQKPNVQENTKTLEADEERS